MDLLSLPAELLPEIFSNLDFKSLLRCCQVCRMFKDVVQSTAELRYIIELAFDGLMDPHTSGASHLDRLQRLSDLRGAWAALKFRSLHKVHVLDNCHAYEFVGGVFCKAGSDFSRVRLPSEAFATVTASTTPDHGLPGLRDFAMDPTQDLVAFIADDDSPTSVTEHRHIKVHLRTLSTHQPHPAARRQIIDFRLAPDPHWGNFMSSVFIQLADQVLAVYIWVGRSGSKLIAWNWKSGEVLFDLNRSSLPVNNYDFSLISSNAYVLTSTAWPGSIQVYTFGGSGQPPIMVARLTLPDLCNGHVNVHQLNTHCGPICANQLPGSSLSIIPEHKIHVLRVQYSTFTGQIETYSIYTRNKTFTDYVAKFHEDASGSQHDLTIPWSVWSPKKTRFMRTPASYNWLRYVHGERVVLPFTGQIQHLTVLEIMDFTPSSILLNQDHHTPHAEIVTEETVIQKDDIFLEQVTSNLPFRRVRCLLPGDFMACMIDHERVVALRESNETGYELHCFTL